MQHSSLDLVQSLGGVTGLLVPYLVFNVLAIWHPLGWQGVIIVALQYWFGYAGFFWGFFLAAYWLDVHAPLPNPVPLPDLPQPVRATLNNEGTWFPHFQRSPKQPV